MSETLMSGPYSLNPTASTPTPEPKTLNLKSNPNALKPLAVGRACTLQPRSKPYTLNKPQALNSKYNRPALKPHA